MRRRALMAASAAGGGKIINTITVSLTGASIMNLYFETYFQALYPVNSIVLIKSSTGNGTGFSIGDVTARGYFMKDETFKIGLSDDGPFAQEIEDDMYIYKLVIA